MAKGPDLVPGQVILRTQLSRSECVRRLEAKSARDLPLISSIGLTERVLIRWGDAGFRVRVRPAFSRNGLFRVVHVRMNEDKQGCVLYCRSAPPIPEPLYLAAWLVPTLAASCGGAAVLIHLLLKQRDLPQFWFVLLLTVLAPAVGYLSYRGHQRLGERQIEKAIEFLCETLQASREQAHAELHTPPSASI